MTIARPFFKYAGSKWMLSKHYPAPHFDMLVEPFAGSACYATQHYERNVFLCEKNPEIAALWDYLIKVDPQEIARLPVKLDIGLDIRTLPISNGGKLLIRQWQRVGMSNCWTVSKWNGLPGLWGAPTRDSVAENVSKIRHWRIIAADYTKLPNPKATWFIDPPYSGLPLYDSKSIDYAQLASWCRGRNGQTIVCEVASATWLPFRPFREVVTGRRGQECSKGKSKEGIWTSEHQ